MQKASQYAPAPNGGRAGVRGAIMYFEIAFLQSKKTCNPGETGIPAGSLQPYHAQHGADKDTEHGGGGREHPKENIPGNSTDFEGHVRTVEVQPADGAERLCIRRNCWLVLFYPGHGNLTVILSV